ncbi:hypothetical protein ABT324_23460 [Saccharopolyspora sp. NPDC000359]|uniref:hypothetical protein n=1 Tax=Saccharopolyspora sp. NPDC000359 TaxID=3154251 RepID=UPI003329A27C
MAEKSRADVVAALADRLGKNRVFGEPVQQGDTTLVPVASVSISGARGPAVRPVGAFAISGSGSVTWHPAVSVNRIVWGGQLALAAVLITAAIAFRRKR